MTELHCVPETKLCFSQTLFGIDSCNKTYLQRGLLVFFFTLSLMPWIQLGRSQQLYIAKAADIVLYQSSKHNKGQSPWQPVKTFSGHHGDVSKFVISGGQLVTCSMDNSVRTWNLQTGKCDGLCLGHEGDVHSVDCFDDVIVTGSRDKTIKVVSINILTSCKKYTNRLF